jgi:hypothetical protein
MPNWKAKAAVQDLLSLLPGSDYWNMLLQRYVTRLLVLTPSRFEQKLSQCRRHLERTESATGKPWSAFSVLELGTGWHPIIPMGMYLSGASVVWTVDIASLLSPDRVVEAAGFFVRYAGSGRLAELLPSARPDRMEPLERLAAEGPRGRAPEELLQTVHVVPLVCDVRRAALSDASVDLFISNCVLEHIPRNDIGDIFRTFKRLARPGAVMSHLVDMADHYADFDPSITSYNFLKYSERSWRWYNCNLHYQNRLRLTDHREVHREAGFRILAEYNVQGTEAALDSVPLAAQFTHYPRQELLVTKAWIISSLV